MVFTATVSADAAQVVLATVVVGAAAEDPVAGGVVTGVDGGADVGDEDPLPPPS
ncbi:MAG: hypothetical protein ACRDTP_06965 [Mycobacteriales bacterium]